MKRAILLALTMGAILSVEAQSNEALMRKGFVRDSLAEVLAAFFNKDNVSCK